MTNEVRTVLEKADDLIYSAMDKGEENWRYELRIFIKMLKSLYIKYPNSGEVCYVLGYCYFNMPGFDPDDFGHARYWLEKSLEINPYNQYALFYMGALFFEYEKYDDAKSYLSLISYEYFEKHNQKWRDLKISEMLLCCNIYLQPGNVRIDEIRKVTKSYIDDSDEDWSLPIELIECVIKYLKKKKSSEVKEIATEIAEFIRTLDISEPFSSELEILETII